MQQCTTCGRTYPNDKVECEFDGTPLFHIGDTPEEESGAAQPDDYVVAHTASESTKALSETKHQPTPTIPTPPVAPHSHVSPPTTPTITTPDPVELYAKDPSYEKGRGVVPIPNHLPPVEDVIPEDAPPSTPSPTHQIPDGAYQIHDIQPPKPEPHSLAQEESEPELADLKEIVANEHALHRPEPSTASLLAGLDAELEKYESEGSLEPPVSYLDDISTDEPSKLDDIYIPSQPKKAPQSPPKTKPTLTPDLDQKKSDPLPDYLDTSSLPEPSTEQTFEAEPVTAEKGKSVTRMVVFGMIISILATAAALYYILMVA